MSIFASLLKNSPLSLAFKKYCKQQQRYQQTEAISYQLLQKNVIVFIMFTKRKCAKYESVLTVNETKILHKNFHFYFISYNEYIPGKFCISKIEESGKNPLPAVK